MEPETNVETDRERTWELPIRAGERFEMEAELAAIRLVASDRPGIEARGRVARDLDLEIDRTGAGVRVRVRRPGIFEGAPWTWWDRGAGAKIVVHLPADVRATVRADAGKIDARGFVGGELDLAADAGEITVDDSIGHLVLKSSAGRVQGERIGGSLEIETDAGSVKLHVVALDPGEHHVHTSVGSIRIMLDPSVRADIDARTTMGSARLEVPSVPGAPARLAIASEVGSVRVRPSSESARPIAPPAPADAHPYRSPAETVRRVEDDELARVLRMVADGKITPDDARDLLRAMADEE